MLEPFWEEAGTPQFFPTNGQIIGSLAQEKDSYLYLTDSSGHFYSLRAIPDPGQYAPDTWNLWHAANPHIPGFINTGPAVGQDHVYYLMRWLGSTSSTSPGTNYGQLVAVEKRSGAIAWTANLHPASAGGQTIPAWGNVEPLVVRDPAGEWVLTGDTAGYVSAFGPGGRPRPFALTDPSGRPVPCSALEDPIGPPPGQTVIQSPRVRLTENPARTPPGVPWSNRAGVGTGMTAARGRLLMGVNKGDGSGLTGKLVALRAASNLVLGRPQIEYQDPEGNWLPLDTGAPVPPGTTLRIYLPVRAELDPQEAKREVPVRVGWATGGYVETTVSFEGPGQTTLGPLTLPAPTGPGTYQLVAVANSHLYGVRYSLEAVQAELGGSAAPAPAPPPWVAGDAALVRQQGWGEALAADNLWQQSLTFATPNQPPVAVISGPSQAAAGEAITLSSSGSYDPDGDPLQRRFWQVDGQVQPDRTSLSLQFDTGGTHLVTLQAQDARGAWSTLVRHPVTVANPPTGPGTDPGPGDPPDGGAGDPATVPPGISGTPACGEPGEPDALTFDPGSCVALAVQFSPEVGRRGDTVRAVIGLGLPAGFTADQVQVDLPPAFQNISFCLGTGQCFDIDNTHTRATGAGSRWEYEFILAWTQNEPPDGDYEIGISARGTYTYTHLHTRTVTETVCEYPPGPPDDDGPPPDVPEPPPTEPVCWEEEREEHFPVTHTVPWQATDWVWFTVSGHWYPYVQVQH